MPIADSDMSRLAVRDPYLASGEGDKFYLREILSIGGDVDFAGLGFADRPYSSNSSRMWPIAKWPEAVMKKLDEVAVKHNWVTEFSGHPYLHQSGFNWYTYTGNYAFQFTPHSGQPWGLRGENCNNVNFWRDFDDRVSFFYDNIKHREGFETAINNFGDLPYTDIVEEDYNQVSGSLTRWKSVFDAGQVEPFRSQLLHRVFDPYGSGYTLFQEYPPSQELNDLSIGFSNLEKFFYDVPYSGLYHQARMTRKQGNGIPYNLYEAYVHSNKYHSLTFFSETVYMAKSATKTVESRGNAALGVYVDPPDYASGIAHLQELFANDEWGQVVLNPPSRYKLGNYQRLDTSFSYGYDFIDTGIQIGIYNSTTGRVTLSPYGNRMTAPYTSKNLVLKIPASDRYTDFTWTGMLRSSFSYSKIPISTRAFSKITTGASGITHKLNERWRNNPSTSIKSRYGLQDEDLHKIFFPIMVDSFAGNLGRNEAAVPEGVLGFPSYNLISTSIGPIMPRLSGTTIGGVRYRFSDCQWFDGTLFSNGRYQSILCDNTEYGALPSLDNLFYTGEGLEIVYGFIDTIAEIHEPNVELLRYYGYDAIDYTKNLFTLHEGARLGPASGYLSGTTLTHILGASGTFFSDRIINRLNTGNYTQLYDRGFPSIQTIGSGYTLETSDFTDNIDFPSGLLNMVPSGTPTYMWWAIKAKEFNKNFVLENPTLLPINNPVVPITMGDGFAVWGGSDPTNGEYAYLQDHPDHVNTDFSIPGDFYISNYTSHFIDDYEVLNVAPISVSTLQGIMTLPTSGITTQDYHKQAFAMKNVDNNPYETLIPFWDNTLYATSILGHLHESGQPAVQLADGSISGDLRAMIMRDFPPDNGYPVITF